MPDVFGQYRRGVGGITVHHCSEIFLYGESFWYGSEIFLTLWGESYWNDLDGYVTRLFETMVGKYIPIYIHRLLYTYECLGF